MVRLFGLGRVSKSKRSPPNQQSLTDLPYLEDDDEGLHRHAARHDDTAVRPSVGRERRRTRRRRRLVATARSPELLRDGHPMYRYALNEYAQTVVTGSSNDDGRTPHQHDELHESQTPPSPASALPRPPSSFSSTTSQQRRQQMTSRIPNPPSMSSTQVEPSATDRRLDRQPSENSSSSSSHHAADGDASSTTRAAVLASVPSSSSPRHNGFARSRFEDDMPTPGYEERYGDAYTGAPLRYVYPAGYRSMRPRSCPWRLSMFITVAFTWLSVFIVGHCSDQVDADLYYNAEIEDDTLLIDVRWCGSRPLYLLWVATMLVNGLAAAYCGVIGYVKCRDFAVANTRAQPVTAPWSSDATTTTTGRRRPPAVSSDYYVRLGPADDDDDEEAASSASTSASSAPYRSSIYQADGEPQFWGQQIYRPTQAAVAVTSR